MPDSTQKLKVEPLSPKDIKRVLFDRDMTIVQLAKLASDELGREVTAWQMRAVIYRFPNLVYQDIREWLAGWLNCEIWQVGNEPVRREAEEAVA